MVQNNKSAFYYEDEDNMIDWSQVVVKPKEVILKNETNQNPESLSNENIKKLPSELKEINELSDENN